MELATVIVPFLESALYGKAMAKGLKPVFAPNLHETLLGILLNKGYAATIKNR